MSVYHISPLRFWLMPGLFAIIALLFFAMALEDSPSAKPEAVNIGIYIGLAFFAFAVGMYFLMRYTRLVLSAGGVKLYQFGYRLETDWENVDYLDDTSDVQGFVLHRPMDCSGAWTLSSARSVAVGGAALYNDEQIRLLGERRLIPIEAFAYHLKRGNLQQEISRYKSAKG